MRNTLERLFLVLLLACGLAQAAPLPPLKAQGTQWVDDSGRAVALKGVNLGNWLLPEFWMMGQGAHGIDDQCKLEAVLDRRFGRAERDRLITLFRENWITARDWDLIAGFGFNAVRVPFLWSVVEDEDRPFTLRADAWRWLDAAVEAAEARGLYVILDLHGAAGAQGREHHSGCAGRNEYWSNPQFQERTAWLWEQVAARYRGRAAVAAYGLLNEPWGAASEDEMARTVKALARRVRAVDPDKVIVLPGHHKGINAYGKPADEGLTGVAFEMHPYPGFFGWDKPGSEVHRRWLQCAGSGGSVCEWQARLQKLDTPFLVGEFQPWAELPPALGGRITRLTFDTYARLGWAATAWSWKWLSNRGGPAKGSWGLVTNAAGEALPKLDFRRAPLAQIEALFRRFGSVSYLVNEEVRQALARKEPAAFALEVPAGWRSVWSDGFDRAGLPDARKWDHDTERNREGWWNHERQYYARARLENTRVQGGRLQLVARKESLSDQPDWGGQTYSSARLVTRGKAAWTYGFFEVRAKLPCGRGTWPAIWMLGTGGQWPDDGELDILEQVGQRPDRVFSTVHTKAGHGGHGSGAETIRSDACSAFHSYQMLWTKDEIRFGIDGEQHYRYANEGSGAARWPFDRPQYLILNIALGGDLGGEIDDAALPVTMEVDHVRVWQGR
jgi:endoglucanase